MRGRLASERDMKLAPVATAEEIASRRGGQQILCEPDATADAADAGDRGGDPGLAAVGDSRSAGAV